MRTFITRAAQLCVGVAAAKFIARRRRAIDFAGRTVVISGGSRGLGLEMARQFAADGARLVLLARDPSELGTAALELTSHGSTVLPIMCDVRDRQAISSAVAQIRVWSGTIDVLVNNAGIIEVGPLENMVRADYEEAMAVHFWGPLDLTHHSLPLMHRGARIVNIVSVGGHVAVPHLLPYCASKFALTGFSDGLRAELARRGIRVTTVIPGLMRTGSHVKARFKGEHKKEFALFALANALPLFSMNAERAARRIVNACRYGDAALTLTPQARALEIANILLPRLTGEMMKLSARLLPGPLPHSHQSKTGLESRSPLAPHWITNLADTASVRNNE